MTPLASVFPRPMPAIRRLCALSPLADHAVAHIVEASRMARSIPARRDLLGEGRKIDGALLLLEGWAARVRILKDGRRQFISFSVPGDIIGDRGFAPAFASCSVTALTEIAVCAIPDGEGHPDLERAYAISRAFNEACLEAQITRLGRFDARERVIDLLLELHERLSLAGIASGTRFDLPLTQEMVADALGLTSVHVNRTLQQCRRDEDFVWTGKRVDLLDVERLRLIVGRAPTSPAAPA